MHPILDKGNIYTKNLALWVPSNAKGPGAFKPHSRILACLPEALGLKKVFNFTFQAQKLGFDTKRFTCPKLNSTQFLVYVDFWTQH